MRIEKTKDEQNFKEIEKKKIFSRNLNEFLDNNFKFLIIIVFFIIILSGYYFILSPQYEETRANIIIVNKERENNYESKKAELEKIKELLLSYSKISPQYIQKINVIVPKRDNKEEIFTELNYLVSDIGLSLESLSIKEVFIRDPKEDVSKNDRLGGKEVKSVKMDIVVKGTDYESFKNLLYSLENNLRLIDIESINFDPVNRVTSLLLVTYFTD